MKCTILFTMVIALIGTIHSDPAFMIGINGNATTITGSGPLTESSSFRPGLGLKLGFEQNFTEHFSFVIGAGLDSRGEQNTLSKNLTETIRQETIEQINMLSLQVPILAQLNIPLSFFRISLFGGPDCGIFLNGKKYREKKVYVPAVNDQPARVDITKDTLDFSRDIKMLDCGVTVGFGFEVKTGDLGTFFLRPSAYIGLINILQTGHEVENNVNLDGKHQAFSVGIGYKFNIRKKMNDVSDYKSSEKSKTPESSSSGSNLDAYRNYNADSSPEEDRSGL